MIRVDQNGITVTYPIHSKGDMNLTADGNMTIDAANLTIQQRFVLKDSGGSI